jgi:hypothetical protein
VKVAVFQVFALLLVAGSAPAYAGDADNSDATVLPAVDDGKGDKNKGDKNKGDKDKGDKDEPNETYDFGGRLFVRDTVTHLDSTTFPDTWNNTLEVDSARVNFNFRDERRGIRIQIEAEFADRADLKDAYFRLDLSESMRVKTGRFKRPMSAVALESKWDLPVLERGVISDLEIPNVDAGSDALSVGGRSEGVQLEYSGKEMPLEPRFYLGVFRGDVHDQSTQLVDLSDDGFPEDVYARVELEPSSGIRVGLSGAWVAQLSTAGRLDTLRRSFVGNIDVTAEVGPLRLWVEGFAGKNPLHVELTADGDKAWGSYFAARAIAALRFSRPVKGIRWLEPWISGQLGDVTNADYGANFDDSFFAISGGINVFLKKSYRVQLGIDHTDIGRNILADGSTKFMMQLAAVF